MSFDRNNAALVAERTAMLASPEAKALGLTATSDAYDDVSRLSRILSRLPGEDVETSRDSRNVLHWTRRLPSGLEVRGYGYDFDACFDANGRYRD